VISTQWIEKRKPHWLQLEKLLLRCRQSGPGSLTRRELQNLSLLYRQTASDLATVREDQSAGEFARYLNQLLLQAHGVIYIGKRAGLKSILTFFLQSYPRIFRENLFFCAAAFGLFLAGGLMGALLSLQSPSFAPNFLNPQMMETIDRGEMWTQPILAVKPLAASGIMTNNISVSFTAFAAGITGGVGTIYMMFLNGLLIGVLGAVCGGAGMSLKLWSFVAPHGALELPAVFIAGGAGLRIARGLLFPGALPRMESLKRAAGIGARLIVGVVPILVIAGLIEAFISPTDINVSLKFVLSAALFVMLSAWLFWEPLRKR
jgi:uncharacterized membrane protein SpoIIM required for sporulation